MIKIVATIIQDQRSFSKDQELSNSQKSANNEINNNEWKSENLNFFDFHLFTSYDIELMIRDNKNIYYRNVHIFIERMFDLIAIKSQKLVKINSKSV